MLFGVTLLFSFILLAVNAWGAPYISFNSKRTGQSDIIYIIDTNGKNLRNLTNHPADDTGATWAPDGRSFAFSSNRDGNYEIYIKKFDEAQVRRLTNHPEDDFDPVWSTFSPSWSPDGNWIAFVAGRTGGLHIYKIDINGKNLQRLTNQGKYNLDPDWSPDGQSIAFHSLRNNILDLYVMDADGKTMNQLRIPRTTRMRCDTFLSFLSRGASHGKSHNILGQIILPHGFPKVFSQFLRLWTPRRPSGVG
jgi:Tol biopolymer transport system component